MQNKLKPRRRFLPLNQIKTQRPHIFPRRKIISPQLRIIPLFTAEKIPVHMPVNMERIIRGNRGFLQQKRIKTRRPQKLPHKTLNFYHLQCNHNLSPSCFRPQPAHAGPVPLYYNENSPQQQPFSPPAFSLSINPPVSLIFQ